MVRNSVAFGVLVLLALPSCYDDGGLGGGRPEPVISVSPGSVDFQALDGGAAPADQTLSISNSGTGTLNWSASVAYGGPGTGWLTLDPTSGSSTGETDTVTLSVDQTGLAIDTHTASITVSDPVASNSPVVVQVTLEVAVPVAPTITSTAVTTAQVGAAYSYDVDATGFPAPTYSLTVNPTGMTVDEATGVLSWTPSAGQGGLNDVTVEANNMAGSDAQSFQIAVDEAPVITSTPVTTGQVGVAYTYDVDASGYPAPTYSLTVSPAGMAIDSGTGVISWTPAAGQGGVHDITVVAGNLVGSDDEQSFQITVNEAPAITSTALTTGEVGVAYSYDVDATGYPAPTYSLITSPTGMSINSATGVISWTPSTGQDGVHDVTARATNAAGTDDQSFQITVIAPPSIATHPADRTVAVGATATFTVVAEGSTLNYQWQKDGADIAGATGSSYTTPATTLVDDAAKFTCVVTNAFGTAVSNAAQLTVDMGAQTYGVFSDEIAYGSGFSYDGGTAIIQTCTYAVGNQVYVLDMTNGFPASLPAAQTAPSLKGRDNLYLPGTEFYTLQGGMGNPGSGGLFRYNWTTQTYTTLFTGVAGLLHGTWHQDTGTIYVATKNFANGLIYKVDVATDAVVGSVSISGLGENPGRLHTSGDGSKLYVEHLAELLIYQTSDMTSIGSIPLSGTANSMTAASPDGAYIAACIDGVGIEVVDTATDTVVRTIPYDPGTASPEFHPDGTKLFLSNGDVIDFNTGAVIKNLGYAGTIVHVNCTGSVAMLIDGLAGQVHLVGTGLGVRKVTAVSPNGGESWVVGNPATVTWSTVGVTGNVKIELSTDGGSTWTEMAASTANDGTETMTVPDSPSSLCRVRVSEVAGGHADVSDGNFLISNGTVAVTYSQKTSAELASLLVADGVSGGVGGTYVHRMVVNAGGGSTTDSRVYTSLGVVPVSGTAKGTSDDPATYRTEIGTDPTFTSLYAFNNMGWVDVLPYTDVALLYMTLNSKWGTNIDTYIYYWFGTDDPLSEIVYGLPDKHYDGFGYITIEGYEIID